MVRRRDAASGGGGGLGGLRGAEGLMHFNHCRRSHPLFFPDLSSFFARAHPLGWQRVDSAAGALAFFAICTIARTSVFNVLQGKFRRR